MADKQKGTGAKNKRDKPRASAHSELGNDVKVSMDNRSRQKRDVNRSEGNRSRQ